MKEVFVLLFLFMQVVCLGQHTRYVELKNERAGYAPRGFYVAHIIDDREDNSTIGSISGDNLNMTNGVAASFSDFIAYNVRQQKTMQPVDLHITVLNCKIKRRGSQWDITADIGTTFSAQEKKLVEFTGKSSGRTSSDPAAYLSATISKAITNDLRQFDEWWAENKSRMPLASAVKVNVTLSRTTEKPGVFVYSLQRPLQYADFKGSVANRSGSEAAATVSGIGLSYDGDVKNSQVVVNITIFANFNTEQSWFRKSDQEARVLAHEQAHFDITALYACRLANAYRTANFTRDNYSKQIEQMQQENAEAVIKEEDLYDAQTRHGTIRDKQVEWQARVRDEVRKCGCF